MLSPKLPKYQSYWYYTARYCPSTRPIDTTQSTSALVRSADTLQTTTAVPVLLIWHSPLGPQYKSYWYPTVYSCPSTSPINTLQSTTTPVPVLLIRHSTLLPQYQSFIYATVYYWPSTSLINTTQYTTIPLPVLLVLHIPLLSKY